MHPVIDTFMRALPDTLRGQVRPDGTTVRFTVSGAAVGQWNVVRRGERWHIAPGADTVAARITMDQHDFWRLVTRGITVAEGRHQADAHGDTAPVDAATALVAVVAPS